MRSSTNLCFARSSAISFSITFSSSSATSWAVSSAGWRRPASRMQATKRPNGSSGNISISFSREDEAHLVACEQVQPIEERRNTEGERQDLPPRMPDNCRSVRVPEVLGEETLHRFIELEAVLFVAEAVSLVVLEDVFDRDAAFLQRRHHLVGFFDIDAWVLGALHDQERRANLVGM